MRDPAVYIDTEIYPLNDPCSDNYSTMVAAIRSKLSEDGCAVLKGFVKKEIIGKLVREADKAAPHGHNSKSRTNVYFSEDDPSLDPSHPRRRFYDRSNAFIPADNFGKGSILREIYEWQPFFKFVRDALDEGESRFFRYADPLADVIVNMAEEGNGFPWHFDTNNYTVTLAIQNAEEGGDFEYAPNIREGDENFDAVRDVLDETSDKVTSLKLHPGDLQIFKGRYSLHRVAPLRGKTPRYVAIYSYVEESGMVGSPERTQQLYGRVLPIHLERAGLRADEYLD
ncbi:MAG: HalD/BesD family halogenase [Rhizobiaceae bacterium]